MAGTLWDYDSKQFFLHDHIETGQTYAVLIDEFNRVKEEKKKLKITADEELPDSLTVQCYLMNIVNLLKPEVTQTSNGDTISYLRKGSINLNISVEVSFNKLSGKWIRNI